MSKESEQGSERDDRPPICPACGVTMGIAVEGVGVRYVCLECGFSEEGADR
jgi:ribosomal protein S27AE